MMKIMRWLEVPETDARLMEAMLGKTTGRVAVGERMSEEILVNIGLRQRRAFSRLQISIVMTLKMGNMKINPGEDYSLKKIIYADCLAKITANTQQLLVGWI